MIKTESFEKLEITHPDALWAWLGKNHGQADSIWLVTWKAANRDKYVSRDDVLDALVAYGWIDGIRRKLDDLRTMQLISPRKQQIWAGSYKARAARLKTDGRMAEPGHRAIAEAKANGLWDAMGDVDALQVPEDLRAAFAPDAAAWFDAAAPSYRRNVLRWIAGAKRAPTRAKRVLEVARRAELGEKVPQY